jgi:hypothetical protein
VRLVKTVQTAKGKDVGILYREGSDRLMEAGL